MLDVVVAVVARLRCVVSFLPSIHWPVGTGILDPFVAIVVVALVVVSWLLCPTSRWPVGAGIRDSFVVVVVVVFVVALALSESLACRD